MLVATPLKPILQLMNSYFPLKTCCPFITFMPNKPDKYGFKFWLLVEGVESKYVVKILPYLGKLEKKIVKADRWL